MNQIFGLSNFFVMKCLKVVGQVSFSHFRVCLSLDKLIFVIFPQSCKGFYFSMVYYLLCDRSNDQQRRKSVQSDQSLCCPYEERNGENSLIRLDGCPG